MAKEFRSNIDISIAAASPLLETHKVFDRNHLSFVGSPIDEFTERLRALNSLAPKPNAFDPYLGQLVLLGAVAAVESYLRTVFRKCIALDPVCRTAAMKRDVSYAAALHLSHELLPEALLERISFTSFDNIEKASRDLLGATGELPVALKSAVSDYVRICHLRHCAVHRFGKLGASNAVHLGIDDHRDLLEKPLTLNYVSLQNSIAIITIFVRVFNSFAFNVLATRICSKQLSGVYSEDRPLFISYYSIFQDKTSSRKSPAPKDVYNDLMAQLSVHAQQQRHKPG